MPVSRAMRATTINSSRSVMPRSRLFLAPADDVSIVRFSAGLPVSAQRDQVGSLSVLSGIFVKERPIPGVVRDIFRQIRTCPVRDAIRFFTQGSKPQRGRWKNACIQFIQRKGILKV